MSKGQTLKALVKERLAEAAEDIFVLFERTIAVYDEELCRSKEEIQRKQLLLDKLLSPRIKLVRGNFEIPSTSTGPGLNQEIKKTAQIKEEPELSVKQEEEQLPVSVPESHAVFVKTEESSWLQQRQTEHREVTQGEDISSEPHFHSETVGHTENLSVAENGDDWEPFSCSASQLKTEAEQDHYHQVQITDTRTAAHNTGLFPQNYSGPEMSGFFNNVDLFEADRKKFQCPVCDRRFDRHNNFTRHIRIHTGEKPFRCSVCNKGFNQKSDMERHTRIHTGEKPYSCSVCERSFPLKKNAIAHMSVHTGEKPFSCTVCKKRFSQKNCLYRHKKIHIRENMYNLLFSSRAAPKSCSVKSLLSFHRGQSSQRTVFNRGFTEDKEPIVDREFTEDRVRHRANRGPRANRAHRANRRHRANRGQSLTQSCQTIEFNREITEDRELTEDKVQQRAPRGQRANRGQSSQSTEFDRELMEDSEFTEDRVRHRANRGQRANGTQN